MTDGPKHSVRRRGKLPLAGAASQAFALRQTRREHAIETAQDYVEAIAELTASAGAARATDLARLLGVSHVTVVRTVARLRRDGYVFSQPHRSIYLTDKGSRLAQESRRRHEIVIEFLRSLGVPEQIAQSDAEGIEHHVSPDTLAAFQRHLRAKSSDSRKPGSQPPRR